MVMSNSSHPPPFLQVRNQHVVAVVELQLIIRPLIIDRTFRCGMPPGRLCVLGLAVCLVRV